MTEEEREANEAEQVEFRANYRRLRAESVSLQDWYDSGRYDEQFDRAPERTVDIEKQRLGHLMELAEAFGNQLPETPKEDLLQALADARDSGWKQDYLAELDKVIRELFTTPGFPARWPDPEA